MLKTQNKLKNIGIHWKLLKNFGGNTSDSVSTLLFVLTLCWIQLVLIERPNVLEQLANHASVFHVTSSKISSLRMSVSHVECHTRHTVRFSQICFTIKQFVCLFELGLYYFKVVFILRTYAPHTQIIFQHPYMLGFQNPSFLGFQHPSLLGFQNPSILGFINPYLLGFKNPSLLGWNLDCYLIK